MFRLGFKNGTRQIIRVDRENDAENGFMFSGKLDTRGNIAITPTVFTKPIVVRCAKRNVQLGEIKFFLDFTQFGPEAFDVITRDVYLTVVKNCKQDTDSAS